MTVHLVEGDGRECTKCHKALPLNNFYKSKSGPFGRMSQCKTCIIQGRRDKGVPPAKRVVYKEINGVWHKKCSNCGEYKPPSEFGNDLRHSDGLQSQCRVCENQSNTRWRRGRGQSPAEYVKITYINNVPHRVCSICKQLLPFDQFSNASPRSQTRSGKSSMCKQCRAANEKRLNECARVFCKRRPPRKQVIQVTCPICNKIFGLRQHIYDGRMRNNVYGKVYCSLKCVGIAKTRMWSQTKSSYAKRIKELLKSNPDSVSLMRTEP
jgi:hypothetical protein